MYKAIGYLSFCGLLLFFTGCKTEDFQSRINRIPPSQADTLKLNGLISNEPGEFAGNSVFVDMSTEVQTSFPRANWDLGFSSGADFKVILNHSIGATAIATGLPAMTPALVSDTASLQTAGTLTLGNSLTTIDPVAGLFNVYLEGTVFGEIAATSAESDIFIVNRGLPIQLPGVALTQRPWRKLRVYRSGSSYVVEHIRTNLAAESEGSNGNFTRAQLIKDPAYNFQYLSFTTGQVIVEPPKALWDFEWTYSTYVNAQGVAVATPDFVLINFAGGVEAAEVFITEALSYETFTESNLTNLVFSASRDAIGTKWRTLINSGGAAGSTVNRDRFYVLKDMQGNIYKLRFMNFLPGDGGDRGRPELEYRLVKDGLSDNP